MRTYISAIICALVAAGSTTLLAQQGFIPAPTSIRLAERWQPADRKGDTRIIGTVVDVRQVPVPYARVQLRNLATSSIEQEATSNGNGEYEFTLLNPSTYVVEMVVVDGYIVALSNAGSVDRYQTLQTVVRLPGRWDGAASRVVPIQNVANYFGMSSQATMTAATLQLAADLNISGADSGEPVSP
jgi:hypothetical protein